MQDVRGTPGSDTPQVRVDTHDARWLHAHEDAWTELLNDSAADRLFMSWHWQCHWWQHFGAELGAELRVVTAKLDGGRLVGIAPVFERRLRRRVFATTTQWAPVGNVWRTNVGEVTEHTDWILRAGFERAAADAIGDHIAGEPAWDELLVAYARADSFVRTSLLARARERRWYVRAEKPISEYYVNTAVPFAEYLSSLGPNTRLRLYGRRGALGKLGRTRLVTADPETLTAQLDKLDRLSAIRWGKQFDTTTRRFYEQVTSAWLAQGCLSLTTLEVEDRPISALLDVRTGGDLYNLRSAFDPDFTKRLSPGLLHLGYLIEAACADPDITRYALLAGGGKKTDYKQRLTAVHGSLESFQLVRRPWHQWSYRLYDRLKRLSPFGYRF